MEGPPLDASRGTPASWPLNATATTRERWIKVEEIVNLEQPVDNPDNPITIFKVPKPIREVNPKAYDPVVAFIGPFHHCPYCWSSVMQAPKMQTKSQLDSKAYKPVAASPGHFDRACPCSTSAMQNYKWCCVWRLLLHSGNNQVRANQLLDACLLKLKEKNDEVRSSYSEELPPWMDDGKLASIMLLDGYFIIYLMLKRNKLLKKDAVGKKIHCAIKTEEGNVVLNIKEKDKLVAGLFTFDRVQHDLLKLENQIPFFIIKLLFDQLKPCKDDLVNLALEVFKNIHPEESKSFRDKEKKSPGKYHHLLHLFYSSRIPVGKAQVPTSAPGDLTSKPKWIPSAMELDRAGVKFQKNEQQPDSFLDITFNWTKKKFMPLFTSGRMKIPPLKIYDSTGPRFHNLMAFEQCYYDTEMYITTYAMFMDCIINRAEDVQLLQSEGILEHGLGNDHEVADLFNQLGRHIHFYPDNYLARQINEINKFYDFKWNKFLAALRRDYFDNPWTTISVLAAIFLLLLTVEQAVFSALSYFRSS